MGVRASGPRREPMNWRCCSDYARARVHATQNTMGAWRVLECFAKRLPGRHPVWAGSQCHLGVHWHEKGVRRHHDSQAVHEKAGLAIAQMPAAASETICEALARVPNWAGHVRQIRDHRR